MAIFKCKMCGGPLEVSENQSVVKCGYCGICQTLPKLDNEKKVALFSRANNLRIKSEFDKAAGIYESIIAEFRDEAEAYWGLVLCKYGIEYVDDGKGSKIPTCHRTLPMTIMEDDDFQQACEYADITAKNIYRDEAKVIDKIQKKILNIALNEDPYDIFICYKETDDITGSRTEDSLIAQDIYTELIRDDYRVFFSRVSLREVAGTEYEPYIYAALSSAKIMLAIGTKHDYYDAVWVKNEWSRFISMMGEDSGKVLIPCFKNMDAYDIPKEFKNMQALDMGDVTFFGSLTESIERIIDKSRGKVSKETIVLNNDIGDVAPLLERGFIFLEDKDWKKADTFFETVLNKDPKNGNAYLGKLLVDIKVSKFEDLSSFFTTFGDNYNYEKIMRFGDSELRESVKNCNDIIARRIEEARKKDIYENALEIMESATTEEMFENAGYMFIEVKDYEDAKQKSEECFEKAEVARIKAEEAEKDAIYKSACAVFDDKHYWHGKETDIGAFEESKEAFIRLNGWRDSEEKIVLCQQRIKEILTKAETERIENVRKAEEERKRVEKLLKRKKVIGIAVCSVAAVVLGFIIVLDAIIIPNGKYNDAVALMDEGNIIEAYEAFVALGNHKDSTEKALSIYDDYKIEKLKTSEVGNVVKFGYCEQDSDFSNGKEEIEWIVLEKQNNRVLVISKFALNFEPYNAEYTDVTWETCTLRYWLNNDFFNSAFTDTEKAFISTVTVSADANPEYTTDPGDDTQDKVFLLSIQEVNEYFDSDSERECEPTKHLKSVDTDIDSPNGIYFWWWLRSPGSGQNLAVCVDTNGSVYESGRGVDFSVCAVRPAMWITIE